MLIDSIENGSYQLLPEITVKAADVVTDIKRKQTVADLSQEEKLRYDSRQSQGYAGNAEKNQASGARVINIVGYVGENQPRDFLADTLEEIDDCEDLPLQATINFKAYHVDAYDSNCDDKATTNAIFMENLSHVVSINGNTVEPLYDSDILSTVPHYDTYHDNDMLNPSV
nr:hypothetical protein [Tanacetum cinerariifolium]